jgi:hypothetical protein
VTRTLAHGGEKTLAKRHNVIQPRRQYRRDLAFLIHLQPNVLVEVRRLSNISHLPIRMHKHRGDCNYCPLFVSHIAVKSGEQMRVLGARRTQSAYNDGQQS